VNPRFALSTPEVFRNRQGDFTTIERPDLPSLSTVEGLVSVLAARRNDLEAPAVRLAPVIGDVLADLRASPGARFAAMSGSGATCFALYASRADAEASAMALAEAEPGWWVAAAPLLADAAA
jgi:4-diphosphocytidyl-2-C-methyl-D-erythritol kinase